MDREIKFRAWDKNHNKMLYVGDNIHTSTQGRMINNFEDEDLMQYTGLKDSKGKDVYEGDILLVGDAKDNDHINPCYHQRKEKVVFMNGKFGKECLYLGKDKVHYNDIYDTDEVIGNIYTTPDLLPKPTDG